MLSPEQHDCFRRQGLVHLGAFLPRDRVDTAWTVTRRVFDEAETNGSAQVAVPPKGKLRGASESEPIRGLFTAALMNAIVELAGGRSVRPMGNRPQFLVTMPNAEEWTVPPTIWHVDLPRLPSNCLVGIQVFTFLSDVVPKGGGTLVVAGSHRLLNNGSRVRSKNIKKRLRRLPYFQDLMSKQSVDRERFLTEPGKAEDPDAGDVPLRVVELCGRPGDVYLADMRLLHTLAPNATNEPRVMLTHRFVIEEFADALWDE
ncbi:MAG: phytanoyl-CoA dioxygenase family protein [Gammaproteobacteria bacterium]|nr:phytanoyl-CoA dioxygenase family protein [Gammaproteobacteria bacterium]MDE0193343.1 phytanoyl-CoA dioxygenase family protein [Gammaproteobacteria bacterium]